MKTTPFVPITTHFDARYSFVDEDAALLASMGHNTITSCLRMDRATIYARTYPAAIAGTGKYFRFDEETSEALLVFQPDSDIKQPTELRVATQWRYPNGVQIDIIPPGLASWTFASVEDGLPVEVANSTVLVSLTEAWAGEELTVTVTN